MKFMQRVPVDTRVRVRKCLRMFALRILIELSFHAIELFFVRVIYMRAILEAVFLWDSYIGHVREKLRFQNRQMPYI